MTTLSDADVGQNHNWIQEPFQMDVFHANTPSHGQRPIWIWSHHGLRDFEPCSTNVAISHPRTPAPRTSGLELSGFGCPFIIRGLVSS